tara:strand:+ start:436 stop:825 length:390 start_codon:yes stop_codon:yes gene_type:complete
MITYIIFKNSDKSFYLGTSTVNSNFETEEFVINQSLEYKENFNYTYNASSANEGDLYAEVIEGSEVTIDADENARMNAEVAANQYKRNRKEAYPPMEDYLDAIVKNDNVALEKYKTDCLAVKTRYPKPE